MIGFIGVGVDAPTDFKFVARAGFGYSQTEGAAPDGSTGNGGADWSTYYRAKVTVTRPQSSYAGPFRRPEGMRAMPGPKVTRFGPG